MTPSRTSSIFAALACVSAACSGAAPKQALRAPDAQRSADGKTTGVTLKLTSFPKSFEETGCSSQAEVRATLLEPERAPLVVKSPLKRGGSLELGRVPAKGSRLRLEIRLSQENRIIFQAEGPLAEAAVGTLNVSLAQDSTGTDGFKMEAAPADTALQIWQGQGPTASTLASTVMLTYGASRSSCSGVLVCGADGKFDPNKAWVLTAAHCMTPSFASFGPEGYGSTRKCTATGTTAVHPEMKHVQISRGPMVEHDLALVQFQCPAAAVAGASCARLNTTSLANDESIIVAGYGKLSTALDAGQLMQTTMKVVAESARDGTGQQFGDILGGVGGGKIIGQASGTGICPGDSGGPTYVIRDNVTYVAGIHSGGTCDTSPNYAILIDLGVAAHIDWITKSMGGGAGTAPSTPGNDPTSPVGQTGGGDTMSPSGAAGKTCSAPTVSAKQGASDK